MFDLDYFVELESQVWRALASGDAQADERLLAPGFVGIYDTGFSGRDEHVNRLRSGPLVGSYTLADARLMSLGDGIVLLSYQANWRRYDADATCPEEVMYVSSIWQKIDGVWRNIFSQDTPALP